MAAEDSTRPARPVVVKNMPLQSELSGLYARLDEIRAASATVVLALDEQNAEQDYDIAATIRAAISNPLFSILERLDCLIPQLSADLSAESD